MNEKEHIMDTAPEKTAPARGAARRALFAALRVIFLWVPGAVLFLVAIVLAAAKLYLSPLRVEKLVRERFNSMSCGDITLRVKSFDPYSGFVIENLVIRNGEEFGRSRFVEIERLVLRYGFFSILIGNVHFDEIGVYRPRIHLEERKGVWNVSRLMKAPAAGKEPEEEEREPEADKSPASKEIRLPISVEFLFKFVLDDLRLYVKSESFRSSVEGLSFGMDVWVPPFKRIEKSPAALSILERMKIELNPKEEMDVSFYSKDAEIAPPLVLTWKLVFDRKAGPKPGFASIFKFGTYRTPVRFRRTHLAPLRFMLSYDMNYDPGSDYLHIDHLGLSFLGRRWLFLSGSVSAVSVNPSMDLRMTESAIVLDDLHPYYVALTGDRSTRFGGTVSLLPLAVRGAPSALDAVGTVSLSGIHFRNPSAEASIPRASLGYSVKMRGDDMTLSARLSLPHFSYALGRDRSGDNGLDLGLDMTAAGGFSRIALRNLSVSFYNPADGSRALEAALEGDVDLKPKTAGKIAVTRFTFRKAPLAAMLPARLARSMEGVPLQKPVDMRLACGFSLGTGETRAAADMTVKLPDFDMHDLRLAVDVIQDNRIKRLSLRKAHLGSESRGLRLDARGTMDMKEPPFSDSDLRLTLALDSPELRPMYGPWKLSGLVKLDARMTGGMKDGKARGSMLIKKFFVKNDEAKLSVDDMNMNFPFEYYFTPRYRGESRIRVDKVSLLENRFFREKENFSIRSVRSKHPAREVSFEYMRNFAASMFFRDNTFEIVSMKAEVLDGSLQGRDILFNLADMNPEHMEFRLVMDVTNVDIGRLDDPDPRRKTRGAELSLNADITGRGLEILVEPGLDKELAWKGNINIHKIGEEFGNRLFKGLSQEKGKSKLGIFQFAYDNAVIPTGFNYSIDLGLMYTTVSFYRKTIGYAIGPEVKAEFDRIPIQEYLRKVREVE